MLIYILNLISSTQGSKVGEEGVAMTMRMMNSPPSLLLLQLFSTSWNPNLVPKKQKVNSQMPI